MQALRSAGTAVFRRLMGAACLAGLLAMAGCANFYVDTATKEVATSEYTKPASPKPVQLLFEFQTKGVTNARATEFMKTQVVDQVRASGLFSEVRDQAVPSGALLSITLDNVPLSDDAFSKGFVTGLTFGLAGSQVTDGYVCTAKYLSDAQPQPVVAVSRHAIHTVIGNTAAPANAVKSDGIEAAVRTMTRQIVSSSLNDLSKSAALQ